MANIKMCDPKGGDPYGIIHELLADTLTEYIDDSLTYLGSRCFAGCTNLTTLQIHNVTELHQAKWLEGCGVKEIALPNLTKSVSTNHGIYAWILTSEKLEKADLGNQITKLDNNAMYGSAKLGTLILRSTTLVTLGGTLAVAGTPFRSGGAGGTIYIPKSLYDHLGDGSANDYKAATNWATVDGYGTITWAQIEGSAYETKYADGTDIPTT